MKVALDIGHGLGKDMGSVAANGLSEHAYWTEHAPKIKAYLDKYKVESRIFKRSDHGGETAEWRAINAWGPDMAVSLHLNSASSSAQGFEAIHYAGSANGIKLATLICDELAKVLDSPNRKAKTPYQGRGNGFLGGIAAPAVIAEPGFLSSVADTARMMKRADYICQAIGRAIILYGAEKGHYKGALPPEIEAPAETPDEGTPPKEKPQCNCTCSCILE